MEIKGKRLPDNSIELVYSITEAEAAEFEGTPAADSANPDASNIFERKTHYCATCASNGRRNTFEAYGDIHAGVRALAICQGAFSLHIGKC